MKQVYTGAARILLLVLGFISLVTGIVGIFVPLLPTTVFLLISAWCFMRSSERFHEWLIEHPRLGPPIRAWRENGSIPRPVKWYAVAMLVISMLCMHLMIPYLWLKLSLILFLVGIGFFIWTRPDAGRSTNEK